MENKVDTIVIRKPKNVRTTYVDHGIRTKEGGYFGTADAGWSYKLALAVELRNIPAGTAYEVEINGINKGRFIKQ